MNRAHGPLPLSASPFPPRLPLPVLSLFLLWAPFPPLATPGLPAQAGLCRFPGTSSLHCVLCQPMFMESDRHSSRHWSEARYKTEDSGQQRKTEWPVEDCKYHEGNESRESQLCLVQGGGEVLPQDTRNLLPTFLPCGAQDWPNMLLLCQRPPLPPFSLFGSC